MDADGQFPHAGHESRSLDADDVADIELFEDRERLFADLALSDEKLDFAGAVLEVGEDRLAHAALGHQPAGDHDFGAEFAFGGSLEIGADLFDHLCAGKSLAVGIDPGGFQLLELGEALGEQYVHIRFRRLRGRDILRFIAHFCDDSAYLKVECKIKQTKLM